MVFAGLFVPGIERSLRNLVGYGVFVIIGGVESCRLLFVDHDLARRTFNIGLAFEHGQVSDFRRSFDPEVRGAANRDFLAARN